MQPLPEMAKLDFCRGMHAEMDQWDKAARSLAVVDHSDANLANNAKRELDRRLTVKEKRMSDQAVFTARAMRLRLALVALLAVCG